MESLERSKAVIDLGKRLVADLSLGNDILAQWMAHLIAERMDAAERASPEQRALAQDACAQVIYQLWTHRNSLPPNLRPLRELEPLIHTLASLDVDSPYQFRYVSNHPNAEELEGTDIQESQALKVALELDYAARMLIQYLLSAAARGFGEKVIPWLDAAISAGADAMTEHRIVKIVMAGAPQPSADQIAQDALLNKIEKLENFSEMAGLLAAELRSQLISTPGDEGGSSN